MNPTAPPPFVSVRALKAHRCAGVARKAGEIFNVQLHDAKHLIRSGLAQYTPDPEGPWDQQLGRVLPTLPVVVERREMGRRVVACLNIWNDAPAIAQTMPTWLPFVDMVVVVDGAYQSTGCPVGPSTDGTLDVIRKMVPADRLVIIESPADGWPSQAEKRNRYFAEVGVDDIAFIIDADETVENAETLRRLPEGLDVGWVRVGSPLYRRRYGQPRLIRVTPDLRYDRRHHWLWRGDQLLTTHQYGGLAEHVPLDLTLINQRGLGHDAARMQAKATHIQNQARVEMPQSTETAGAASDKTTGAREALRILNVTLYDAGLAVSRFHAGINATTPHASIYFRDLATGGPFGVQAQFDRADEGGLAKAVAECDVVHCHLSFRVLPRPYLKAARWLVLHHHGSMYRTAPKLHVAQAQSLRAIQLVSNLELLQYGPAAWLPNPVPVRRYQRLRREICGDVVWPIRNPAAAFRISHSPSKRHLKGTEDFIAACESLRSKGVNVEPVLIEGQNHGDALRMKASCDAAFDSFWLGIQCSGIEAAAMGMPVIAGDAHVANEYRNLLGGVPYTFASDRAELETAIAALAQDAAFYQAEAARVSEYVATWHDEAAVALRYLNLLDNAFQWRSAMTRQQVEGGRVKKAIAALKQPPLTQSAPAPQQPVTREPQRQEPEPTETRP